MAISTAIEGGVLAPGARLPSWQDLAAQLGVARGTVRQAYQKLSAGQLIVASRSAGTRVAERPRAITRPEQPPDPGSFMAMYQEMTGDRPSSRWVCLARTYFRPRCSRASARVRFAPKRAHHPSTRTLAASLTCGGRSPRTSPSPAASNVLLRRSSSLADTPAAWASRSASLELEGQKAWVEEPGFPFTRRGLQLAGLSLAPIPVDDNGIDVDHGLRRFPDAKLVVVTPGQQAPLGVTLSLERRLRLLDWAAREGVWVIEDDYLSELQLTGRAAPALASLDRDGRVIHIGSFSKTMSPALRLGFLVAPIALLSRFAEVAACLAPPPGPSVQLAIAEFMREGHYLRHLRRTKRAYSAQRDELLKCLQLHVEAGDVTTAGLAVLLRLPEGAAGHIHSQGELGVWFGADPIVRLERTAGVEHDRGFFSASRRRRRSILRDPANVCSGSSSASSESCFRRAGSIETHAPWRQGRPWSRRWASSRRR